MLIISIGCQNTFAQKSFYFYKGHQTARFEMKVEIVEMKMKKVIMTDDQNKKHWNSNKISLRQTANVRIDVLCKTY